MTDAQNPAVLARLAELLERMEAMERRAAKAEAMMIPADAYGNPGRVAAGELIESAWGNAVVDHVIPNFPTLPDLIAGWPSPPNGAIAQVGANGVFFQAFGGNWANRDLGTYTTYFDATYNSRGIDTSVEWVLGDSVTWPVDSVVIIHANVGSSGWGIGVVPSVDLYSNSYPNPFRGGVGFEYAVAHGAPFIAENISPTLIPQTLPSLTAVQRVAAGAAPLFTVRCVVHDAAGFINWSGFIHATMTRTPSAYGTV